MVRSFWNLDRKWIELTQKLEESEGELTEEILELIAINRNDIEDTVSAQLLIIDTLEADNERLKEEMELIKAKIESNKKSVTTIKQNIVAAVKRYGNEEKLKVGVRTLSIKRTKVVEISDVSQIPSKFCKYTLETPLSVETKRELLRLLPRFNLKFKEEVKKDELKDAFKKGEVMNFGFKIKDNESLVRR